MSDTLLVAFCQRRVSTGTGLEVERLEGDEKVGSKNGATLIVNLKLCSVELILWNACHELEKKLSVHIRNRPNVCLILKVP